MELVLDRAQHVLGRTAVPQLDDVVADHPGEPHPGLLRDRRREIGHVQERRTAGAPPGRTAGVDTPGVIGSAEGAVDRSGGPDRVPNPDKGCAGAPTGVTVRS